jgi:hypothetical protein
MIIGIMVTMCVYYKYIFILIVRHLVFQEKFQSRRSKEPWLFGLESKDMRKYFFILYSKTVFTNFIVIL